MKQQGERNFTASDQWMGRTVSCLIKLSWTEEEVAQRAATLQRILEKILREA
jgi:8-amino-3,8-dideoxy-alpha-D-manno-octulosonate transaminase